MPGPERRLAAILSADIAGYSRLMAEDEEETIRLVTARRQQVGLLLEQHRGGLVDFTGDNFLAEFASAVDAVECAVEIQEVGRGLNAALPPERKMEFRIGVDLGEVQAQDDRLFGTGVNVAARLEGLADPGGVCISAKVHEEVAGRTPFSFHNLGAQRLKNIPEPVNAYAVDMPEALPATAPAPRTRIVAAGVVALVALAAVGWWVLGGDSADPAAERKPPTSLVVLPFDDLSPEGDQEYFAHGMSEELINALTRVPELDVKGRTTGEVVKEMGLDIPQIGEQIGVGAVIEGSVRKAGDRLRVTVQLISVHDGFHLWSESYDRPVGDVFAIQDAISRSVANALRVRFLARTGVRPSTSVSAYDLYLEARTPTLTEPGIRRTIELLERVLQLDPDFAPGHASLSFQFSDLCGIGYERCDLVLPLALTRAQRALELDPELPRGHAALGIARINLYDWLGAEEAFRRASELDPGNGAIHGYIGRVLVWMGRVDEGIDEIEAALELDPLSPNTAWNAGAIYNALGRHERAVELFEFATKLVPVPWPVWLALSESYAELGNGDEALRASLQMDLTSEEKALIRQSFSKSGIEGLRARRLEVLVERSGKPCTSMVHAGAGMYVQQGRLDEALGCLQRGADSHSLNSTAILKDSVWFDPLRDDPRFQAILEGMGLAD